MSSPVTTHSRANTIAAGVFLICLGFLFYTNWWWPGILLAIAVSTSIKDYLRGRIYDMVLSIAIFGGLFAFFYFNADMTVAVPVLLTLAGIFLIVRELYFRKPRTSEDRTEDVSQQISDESHHD